MPHSYGRAVDLASCPARTHVRILAVDVPGAAGLRLRELGLRPGALVEVTHDVRAQGRVVAVGAERFAVDRPTCRRIDVALAA